MRSTPVLPGIHAREWASPSTLTYIISRLTHNASEADKYDFASQERLKVDLGMPLLRRFATQYFDWYILPVLNPDGYKHTWEGDRMWRKNRYYSCHNEWPNGCSFFSLKGATVRATTVLMEVF